MSLAADNNNRQETSFWQLFTPKLVSVFREGYSLQNLGADALAGLTVAIVALPLSMAIAIASGASPAAGLFTAVIGGFLVSALGGSRYQIGGPAGAFIVLVAVTIEKFGYQGFLMATIMGGLLLLLIGYLKLGTYIKYIPHPVLVGFTSGIAIIIFVSQIKDLLGLTLAKDPSAVVPKIMALWGALGTFSPYAVGLSVGTIVFILAMKAWNPRFPGMLVSIVLAGFVTWFFHLPVETIGTKFGGIPSGLPRPQVPGFDLHRLPELLPAAITIGMLAGVESLLSAVVADGMTGRRHRSNCELVAQGYANIASAFFGGIAVTGTIARTATNVRSHAHGPVAGILHAAFLLAFMMIAAPLASYIPLASLAGVLAVVSWNMAEKAEFIAILRHDRGEAAVLLATFFLTVFRDLTEGIVVGVTMGSLLFMHRMAQMVEVSTNEKLIDTDQADTLNRTDQINPDQKDVIVYRIAGAFFFGTAGQVSSVLENIGTKPRAYILDMSGVPLADATGAHALLSFAQKVQKQGAQVFLTGVGHEVLRVLIANGLSRKLVTYASSIPEAQERLKRRTERLAAQV